MKFIILSQGKLAVVDDEDYDYLIQYDWFAHKEYSTWYAYCKNILMHRLIMKTPKHLLVDHIDHDGLNNQKINLRHCTRQQNARNNTSTGVYYHKANQKYIARITINSKSKHVGCFNTEREAMIAYNEAAIHHYGEFACLNKIEVL